MKFKRPKYKLPNIKAFWNWLLTEWQAIILIAGSLVLALGLMLIGISSLTPGLSAAEITTYESAKSLQGIADNMVNAPYKLAVFAATNIFDSAFGLRLTGALLGALSIVIFYLLARQLFNKHISIATTAMFATSSLLLSTARQATPNVMLLSLLAIIGVGFCLRFSKRQETAWILTALVVGLSVYVPGMIFFIVAAALWQLRHVRKSFERLEPRVITAASVIFGVLLAPLIVNLIREPGLWRAYLGFPEQFAPAMDMVKYAGTAVVSLYARSPYEPSWWLGRQPVMDILTIFMFNYGIWTLLRQYRLDRLWTMGGVFLLSLLWIGATTNRMAIVILLPFVYILVGIGLQQFVNKWTGIFPRNPIARWTGGILLFAAIVVSINFQSHRYFVAWPNNDETKAQFTEQYPS